MPELLPLDWSQPSSPDKTCSYDHCRATTPFGTFLIEWKSWKGDDDGHTVLFEREWVGSYYDLIEAKEASAEWFKSRVIACLKPT